MRPHDRVRAHRDLHARLMRRRDRLAVDVRDHPRLLHDRRRQRRTRVRRIDDRLRRLQSRDEERVLLEEQLDRLRIQVDAVLDRPHPCTQRVADPLRALCVRHDIRALRRGLRDDHLDLRLRELAVPRIVSG